MTKSETGFRRFGAHRRVASLRAAPSLAADAVERPYDPPVGSHWIIETETTTDDKRPDGPQTSLTSRSAPK